MVQDLPTSTTKEQARFKVRTGITNPWCERVVARALHAVTSTAVELASKIEETLDGAVAGKMRDGGAITFFFRSERSDVR